MGSFQGGLVFFLLLILLFSVSFCFVFSKQNDEGRPEEDSDDIWAHERGMRKQVKQPREGK